MSAWKIVPVEATLPMCKSGVGDDIPRQKMSWVLNVKDGFSRMLAAAPRASEDTALRDRIEDIIRAGFMEDRAVADIAGDVLKELES